MNWTYQRSPNIFLPNINGAFRFGSWNHINANTTYQRLALPKANPVLDFREYDTFLYGGDDWKIGQNLTVQLGLTWSYYGQPANLFNEITTKRESNRAQPRFWNPALPLSAYHSADHPGSEEQLRSERRLCLLAAVGWIPDRSWQDHVPWRLSHAV